MWNSFADLSLILWSWEWEMKLCFLRSSTSASKSGLSHCVQRGGARIQVLRDGICFSGRKPFPQIQWVYLGSAFFSSLFPHFASVCLRYLILGMTDIKFLMSWLQGVDFHCIFCWFDAGSWLMVPSIRYIHMNHPFLFSLPPVRGCAVAGPAPPILKLSLLFCIALLPANVLKCPTKPFSPLTSPANTTLTTFQATLLAHHFLI